MERKHRWPRFSSITTKIILVNIFLLSICAIGLGVFNFSTFQNDSVETSVDRALTVAEAVSLIIDGDNFAQTIASGDKNDIWLHEKELVDSILKLTDFTYLYILDAEYDDSVTYYLEAESHDGSFDLDGTDYTVNYAPEMFQTIETGESSTTGVYESGEYGKMVSGFAAVRDSSGTIVGVVGVDISLRDVFSPSLIFEFLYRQLITIILCSILPILLQIFLFRHMIGSPIKKLTTACAKIGGGDLDVSLSIHSGDEIEELSNTLTKMTMQLKQYIIHLTEITTEKERISAELNIATQIQTSMLPSVSSLSPQCSAFDIYAMMQPAKEVGGDFYDFFLVDNQTLAIVIADVSGKGIPSALFMVISKTLIKSNAQYGKTPKEVFETVNNMLCENNEADMFVTGFLGYLDIPSGNFTFVNAGHNPPLLRSEGYFDWLKMRSGFVLAGMKDMSYNQGEITLRPGDELFLYTDGITEAMNYEDELFGDIRLLEMVQNCHDLPLKGITESIMHEIDAFSKEVEQADDITMLALRYHGLDEREVVCKSGITQ